MSTSIDPHLMQISLFYKKDFYQQASNYLQAVQSYSSELETAINFAKSKVANDPITTMGQFFIELDKKMKSMSPQFAANWIKTFNSAHEQVRNEVGVAIGTGTFYRSFSDSIGVLTRQENVYDESTQSVLNNAFPLRYGASLTNKIHPRIQLLHGEISNKLNTVMNKNLKNIQTQGTSPDKAHGENLVPDIAHVKRVQGLVPTLNQRIRNEFKELYNVISFYCNYNPRSASQNIQFVPNINISVNVEGTPVNQDVLFNQLQDVKRDITTKKVLGVA